jgi:hypothetical protein
MSDDRVWRGRQRRRGGTRLLSEWAGKMMGGQPIDPLVTPPKEFDS